MSKTYRGDASSSPPRGSPPPRRAPLVRAPRLGPPQPRIAKAVAADTSPRGARHEADRPRADPALREQPARPGRPGGRRTPRGRWCPADERRFADGRCRRAAVHVRGAEQRGELGDLRSGSTHRPRGRRAISIRRDGQPRGTRGIQRPVPSSGPLDTGTLWQGFPVTDCTDPSGDPIVVYDKVEALDPELSSRLAGTAVQPTCLQLRRGLGDRGCNRRLSPLRLLTPGPTFPGLPEVRRLAERIDEGRLARHHDT